MDLFPPPNYSWKTRDRMEREHGVCVVVDPLNFHWEDFEWDFSRPFTPLARRVMCHPNSYLLCGPLSQRFVWAAIQDAREHSVHGANTLPALELGDKPKGCAT